MNNFVKFRLLMHTRWKTLFRCKGCLIFEIFLPYLLIIALAMLRTFIENKKTPQYTYEPVQIKDEANMENVRGFSPDYTIIKELMSSFPNAKPFASRDGMETHLKTFKDDKNVGVHFFQKSQDKLDKNMTIGLSFGSNKTDWFFGTRENPSETEIFEPSEKAGGPPYYSQHFVPLMYTLTKKIIEKESKDSKLPNLYIQRLPYSSYKHNTMINMKYGFKLTFIFLIAILVPTFFVPRFINREVQTIEKKVMMIRGFPSWIIWTTWFLRYTIPFLIFSILSIMILFWDTQYGAIYEYSNIFLIFLLIFLVGMLFFAFACFLAVLCPTEKLLKITLGLQFVYWIFCESSELLSDICTVEKIFSDKLHRTEFILMAVLVNLPVVGLIIYELLHKYLGGIKYLSLVTIYPIICFGFDIVSTYEIRGQGVHWSNMVETNDIDNMSLGVVYLILIFEIIAFFFLAILCEALLRRKEEFFVYDCKNIFKKVTPTDIPPPSEDTVNEEFFDEEPAESKAGIKIISVSKDYGPNQVLRNVALNIYENQITILLGHNGAGKSTLISILIGLVIPSHGTAVINGFDISRERVAARKSLSICFQEDTLMDGLTVQEHLVYYLVLKGIRYRSSKEEINEILRQLNLEDKAHERVYHLSGGMKRKLNVAIAFCGHSKVLMLDEPTAGLDPTSRRNVWDFIEKNKAGRTILMTTHFMDEADVLGERIAIMCHGRIVCCGSSFFLKKKYGTGYHLIIDRTPNSNPNNITALIRQYIPGTEVDLMTGTELFYSLPAESSPKFSRMLRDIESQSQKLGVKTFGISLADLEEVFMKVGSTGTIKKYKPVEVESEEKTTGEMMERKSSGPELFRNQFLAMVYKHNWFHNQNSSALIMNVLISVILITVVTSHRMHVTMPSFKFTLKDYYRPIAVVEYNTHMKESFLSWLKERMRNVEVTRSITTKFLEMGNSSFSVMKSRYILGTSFGSDAIYAWFNGEAYHSLPLSVQLILQHEYKSALGDDYYLEFINMPTVTEKIMDNAKYVYLKMNAVILTFIVILLSTTFIEFYITERTSAFKHQQFISGVNTTAFHLSSFTFHFFLNIILILVPIAFMIWKKPVGLKTFEDFGLFFLFVCCFSLYGIAVTVLISFVISSKGGGSSLALLIMIIPAMVLLFFNALDFSIQLYVLRVLLPSVALIDAIDNRFTKEFCLEVIRDCMRILSLSRESCRAFCTFDSATLYIALDLLIIILMGLLLFGFIVIIDSAILTPLAYYIGSGKTPPKSSEDQEDEDVLNEASFVSTYNINKLSSNYVIILRNLTKSYGNLTAVNGLSLTIQKAECFGLLGINGAGKTTTFKMMTGLEMISYGDCWINGYNVKSQFNKARKYIGYCSQFGSLLPGLTARETIEIISLIRGVPRNQVKDKIIELAQHFDFEDHLDKKIENLSGGNRRKLCASLAVIGDPPIVFLDEPTTGMDPATKHFFWDAIHKIRERGTSIVLTSHSMEECEALCTRLAIMVKGSFQCLGSIQHLKSRFAKGFFIMIKLRKSNRIDHTPGRHVDTAAVEQFMAETFPTASLREKHNEFLRYEIEYSDMRWSEIFDILEHMKTQFDIEDYAVGQPRLEQIFLKFSKLAEEKYQNEPKKKKRRFC